jgi:ATP-dependent protease ClpP protease subunit
LAVNVRKTFAATMAKEVLLYGDIYSERARQFISALTDAEGQDISVRVNSSGGDVDYGWGMVAKFSEFKGKKTVKVDGSAASMAAFFTVYADNVEALDVSSFMFHRAAYPDWYEQDANRFNDARKKELNDTNDKLRAALESKVTAQNWFNVTGVSLDEMFSLNARVDVTLTATQAKELGLVNSINTITPAKKAEIDARMLAVAEDFTGLRLAAKNEPAQINSNQKQMTIEKFKSEHPDIFAQALAQGAEQERDRVSAWMVYVDVDAKAVADGIKGGKNITQAAMAELGRKALSKEALANASADSATSVTTEEPETVEKPAEAADIEAFRTAYKKELGINVKTN